jgi:DnaJ-domain-containing protein 1
MTRARARPYDRPQVDPSSAPRPCDHRGCAERGEYRAPRDRGKLNDYYWFCLAHVREYNASWDFYKGMGADALELERRADVIGRRPTWPMGVGKRGRIPRNRTDALEEAMRRWFAGAEIPGFDAKPKPEPRKPRKMGPVEEALALLELDWNATFDEIKSRYKSLVKRHHPDANGGDKAAEERLKSINQAYTILKAQIAKQTAGPERD